MLNKIYNQDCVITMSFIKDNFIDLTITSPPYDDLRKYNGYSFDFENVANELYRITKPGGAVAWIVGDSTVNGSETLTSFKQAIYFKSIGFNIHDTMIYHKTNAVPVGGNNRYYQKFEYIFILSKGAPNCFNPIIKTRDNKYNDKRTSRIKGFNRNIDGSFNKKEVRINDNVKIGNVWSYVVGGGNSSVDKESFKHPAIFPEKLCFDLMVSWSNENDIIYDPFMGSGTTAKMAILNNRNYIGSELSSEYCEIAEKRIFNVKNNINIL